MNYSNQIIEGAALDKLKEIDDESIDLIVTDPPYGYSFMGKQWDKAVVSVPTWKECLRVLKAGAFAFVMSAPRQDVLSRMIVNLQDAGFRTDFTSIYWTYASGFPKAANVSKLADKRADIDPKWLEFRKWLRFKLQESGIKQSIIDEKCKNQMSGHYFGDSQPTIPTWKNYCIIKETLKLNDSWDNFVKERNGMYIEAEREIIGQHKTKDFSWHNGSMMSKENTKDFTTKTTQINITKSATDAAKKLDGSYAGFQPKPALEVILVVMKPLSQKSFVDQALANGKGVTWLDDCRIPIVGNDFIPEGNFNRRNKNPHPMSWDDKLNIKKWQPTEKGRFPANLLVEDDALNGHSKYFDLDAWYSSQQLEEEAQFIITPKASASERNKGLDNEPTRIRQGVRPNHPDSTGKFPCCDFRETKNNHPTVKPLKLMSYLITMGSRENDIVLDPFCGSGTTLIAAHQLNRRWIGIELNAEYAEIARKRIEPYLLQTKLNI